MSSQRPKNRYPGVYRRGSKWHYVYDAGTKSDGKRDQRSVGGFPTAKDAWDAKRERLAELGKGQKTTRSQPTVAEWVEEWIGRQRKQSPATIYRYRSNARLYINPTLGDIKLRALTAGKVRSWLDDLEARGLSARTIEQARVVLNSALRAAVKDHIIPTNALQDQAGPPIPKHRPAIWNETQIRSFLAVADADELSALWRLAIMVELRAGELQGLRWDDVDLDRGIVSIHATRSRDIEGKSIYADRPKTRSSERRVDLPQSCITALRAQRKRVAELRLRYGAGWKDHGYVFPGQRGEMLSHSTILRRLNALAAEAGLPRLTPHELRHSGATWQMSLNEPLKVISERLGHSDPGFTARMYQHVLPGMQRRASDRLDEALGRSLETAAEDAG